MAGNDLGYRARPEHDVHAQPRAHSPAFGELRETAHQPDGQPTPAALLLAKLAQEGLSFLDRFAPHGAGVYEHEIGFAEVVNE